MPRSFLVRSNQMSSPTSDNSASQVTYQLMEKIPPFYMQGIIFKQVKLPQDENSSSPSRRRGVKRAVENTDPIQPGSESKRTKMTVAPNPWGSTSTATYGVRGFKIESSPVVEISPLRVMNNVRVNKEAEEDVNMEKARRVIMFDTSKSKNKISSQTSGYFHLDERQKNSSINSTHKSVRFSISPTFKPKNDSGFCCDVNLTRLSPNLSSGKFDETFNRTGNFDETFNRTGNESPDYVTFKSADKSNLMTSSTPQCYVQKGESARKCSSKSKTRNGQKINQSLSNELLSNGNSLSFKSKTTVDGKLNLDCNWNLTVGLSDISKTGEESVSDSASNSSKLWRPFGNGSATVSRNNSTDSTWSHIVQGSVQSNLGQDQTNLDQGHLYKFHGQNRITTNSSDLNSVEIKRELSSDNEQNLTAQTCRSSNNLNRSSIFNVSSMTGKSIISYPASTTDNSLNIVQQKCNQGTVSGSTVPYFDSYLYNPINPMLSKNVNPTSFNPYYTSQNFLTTQFSRVPFAQSTAALGSAPSLAGFQHMTSSGLRAALNSAAASTTFGRQTASTISGTASAGPSTGFLGSSSYNSGLIRPVPYYPSVSHNYNPAIGLNSQFQYSKTECSTSNITQKVSTPESFQPRTESCHILAQAAQSNSQDEMEETTLNHNYIKTEETADHVHEKSLSCEHCGKEYSTSGALKMHIRTHTLPCQCPVCGKAFSRPWLLQGHMRTHTGERPFSCDQCGRAFADRSNLRAHVQTHSERRRYNCDVCGKSFSRLSLLNRHKAAESRCQVTSST